MYPMYYVYNALLMTLQVLHVIWFAIILRMVYGFVAHGKVTGRSLAQWFMIGWLGRVQSPSSLATAVCLYLSFPNSLFA